MTREVQQTEGQRRVTELEQLKQLLKQLRVEVYDIIALEVLSGINHQMIARSLMQIVNVKPRGNMSVEKVDIREPLGRTLYQLQIGDLIDSDPNSLNPTNLYRIKNILTPDEAYTLLKRPDSQYQQTPAKDCYVLGRNLHYQEDPLELFQWNGARFDGIWGLPDYHRIPLTFFRGKTEREKLEEHDPLPRIDQDITVYDKVYDDHLIRVENIISGPTLIKRLF